MKDELRIPLTLSDIRDAEDTLLNLSYSQIEKCVDFTSQIIRNYFSRFLEGTDEAHPMAVDICPDQNGHNGACGLSSLLMPRIVSMFQQPGEGLIWFRWDREDIQELEDLPIWEQLEIIYELETYYSPALC